MYIEDIFNLAVLSDKYDVLSLVQFAYPMKPWNANQEHRGAWALSRPSSSSLLKRSDPRWLYVAYAFGHEADFVEQANYLARSVSIDAEGQLMTESGQVIEEGWLPDDLLERIFEVRHETITALLAKVGALLENPPVCQHEEPSCRTSLIGSFTAELRGVLLVRSNFTLVTPDDIDMSVERLARHLRSIRVLNSSGHNECKRRFHIVETHEIVAARRSPVTHAHLTHIRHQASRYNA